MFKIITNVDNKSIVLDESCNMNIQLSKEMNNGLSYTSDNKIKATKGKDGLSGTGGTMNIPGNGIEGIVNKGIITVRCNNSVSRKVTTEEDIPDCINVHDMIISKILNIRR